MKLDTRRREASILVCRRLPFAVVLLSILPSVFLISYRREMGNLDDVR